MKSTKPEIDAVSQVATQAAEDSTLELNELQLALVGGGITDPVLH